MFLAWVLSTRFSGVFRWCARGLLLSMWSRPDSGWSPVGVLSPEHDIGSIARLTPLPLVFLTSQIRRRCLERGILWSLCAPGPPFGKHPLLLRPHYPRPLAGGSLRAFSASPFLPPPGVDVGSHRSGFSLLIAAPSLWSFFFLSRDAKDEDGRGSTWPFGACSAVLSP